jgi:cytochrome c oxidase subunit 2
MKIEKFERFFLYATAVVLVVFFGSILLSVGEANLHLPSQEGVLDPRAVSQTPPFDSPGVFSTGPDTYTVVMVAQAWAFTPNQIVVPQGSEVTFYATSRDVIHGLLIPDTTINAMVIPGQVTKVTYRFDEAGEFLFVCHEFCGIGHAGMFGKVVVEG